MPIYSYKCDSCGFERDLLQKISDAPITECPQCHQAKMRKQVTASGFQLKGNGWYATDFKSKGLATKSDKSAVCAAEKTESPCSPSPATSKAVES